jgi:hypothetical protein
MLFVGSAAVQGGLEERLHAAILAITVVRRDPPARPHCVAAGLPDRALAARMAEGGRQPGWGAEATNTASMRRAEASDSVTALLARARRGEAELDAGEEELAALRHGSLLAFPCVCLVL